jgi:glycine cleavage system H protein
MNNLPAELRYSRSHEWVRVEGDHYVIGISDHAQCQLGDVVYVELPEVGSEVVAGAEVAVIESVKVAADVYSPVSGSITAVNTNLNGGPELINQDPYGHGWIYKIKPSQPAELEKLLTASAYDDTIDESH